MQGSPKDWEYSRRGVRHEIILLLVLNATTLSANGGSIDMLKKSNHLSRIQLREIFHGILLMRKTLVKFYFTFWNLIQIMPLEEALTRLAYSIASFW